MRWVKPPSVARKSPLMGCDLCRVASSFMVNPHLLMLQTFSTNGCTGGCSSTTFCALDFIMLSVIYLNLLEVISVLIRTYTNTNKKITPGHPQESHHFIEKFASQMLCTAQAAAFSTLGTSDVLAHRSRETLWHLGFEHRWHQWKHEINKNGNFTNWLVVSTPLKNIGQLG